MRLHLLHLATFLLCSLALQAQDPAFSQFYANRLYLNPAFGGSQPGVTLGTQYRSQWNYVQGAFTTYTMYADVQEPYLSSGFGLLATYDREGSGLLTTQSLGLNYAYIIRPSETFNIHIGVRTSYYRKMIDWSRLVFTDELDPVLGIVYPSNAQPITESIHFADFDAGILLRFGTRFFKQDATHNIGLSVNHLNEPEESLQQIETRLPRRFTFHYGSVLPVLYFSNFSRRVVYVSPNLKYDVQGEIQVFTYGAYVASNPLYLGIFYQNRTVAVDRNNTNAVIFTAGFEGTLNKATTYQLGYSFDANVTGVSTRAQGVHEISLRINFGDLSFFGQPGVKGRYKGKQGMITTLKGRRQGCYSFQGQSAVNIF